jgi:hypothetical protein
MKHHWTKTPHSDRLILFMNGWGMDTSLFTQAPPPVGWDVFMFYDYADLGQPVALSGLRESYARIVLVAWSMGVWAAGETFAGHTGLFDRAVAINGTARPIDAQYGIDPDMYRATLDGFSATTRDTFYRRMCHTPERLDRFLAAPPARSVENQAAELKSIMAQTERDEPARIYPFDEVIIGKQDRIMRYSNQVRFWTDRAPCRVLNAPHHPFFDVTWEELLHADTDGR